jgi:hypothetical protein
MGLCRPLLLVALGVFKLFSTFVPGATVEKPRIGRMRFPTRSCGWRLLVSDFVLCRYEGLEL